MFANLKKCRFHKKEVRFLCYVVLSQSIWMEDERIKAVKNWTEPKSVQDIQIFIGFANFYRQFIWGFSKIAAPLTSILKMTRSSDSAPRLEANDNEVVRGGDKADDKNLSKFKKSKNAKSEIQTYLGVTGEPTILTPTQRRLLTNWGKRLPQLWSFDTLIRNVISGLRPTLQAMP